MEKNIINFAHTYGISKITESLNKIYIKITDPHLKIYNLLKNKKIQGYHKYV